MKNILIAATIVGMACASASSAATVFEDDFSGDLANVPAGNNGLNFDSFDNFSVSGGTVDFISSGSFGITCATGGACVDLDGSSSNSGLLSSIELNFQAGINYSLFASISGNQRDATTDTGTFGVTGLFSASYSVSGSAFNSFTGEFTPASDTTGSVFFQNDGGDNKGAVLDQVSITASMAAVPLPASALLLLGGLGGLAIARRRRKA